MDINNQFHSLMSELNSKAAEAAHDDDNDTVQLLEDSMEELLDAWTDYIMSNLTPPEMGDYMYWFHKIESWR